MTVLFLFQEPRLCHLSVRMCWQQIPSNFSSYKLVLETALYSAEMFDSFSKVKKRIINVLVLDINQLLLQRK